MVKSQRIYMGVGAPGQRLEVLVNLGIEENNREDVLEVLESALDLIYDGEYDEQEDE